MKSVFFLAIAILLFTQKPSAQVEPHAGSWKPWFISSVKDFRLSAPASNKKEIAEVLSIQQKMDANSLQQMQYWNAGAPGYRWSEIMTKLWTVDTGRYGVLAGMLMNVAIYDATIAAWDTKYAFKSVRPYETDKRIKALLLKAESPSYPCEYSVAAGAAVTIISRFYPHLADSVQKMAQRIMASRVAAGLAFPSDTEAGFNLGKTIALKEIEDTKEYICTTPFDGKIPEGKNQWKGKFAMYPMAKNNKTIVLDSAGQFRPGPPPDFAKEMEELKNFKHSFRSRANAFYYASQNAGEDLVTKKIFEYNLHLNPPRAARLSAASAVVMYDGFIACWDAKYTYWGIRPDQYDTTYKPLMMTPPFPGYPSGHAMAGGSSAELLSYFFPHDKAVFDKHAKDGAESRFQAGIHFRSDNEEGTSLGRKIARAVIERVRHDGADIQNNFFSFKKQ
jgi:membrane-associated phospholipid phosphatase